MPEDNLKFEFLSLESLSYLNYQQKVLHEDHWSDLIDYLRKKGKDPDRNIGFAESNVRPIARRIHQFHQYCWDDGHILDQSQEHADQFISDLNDDNILTNDGSKYTESSKRKFRQALEIYFEFLGVDWESSIKFSRNETNNGSDPFRRKERELLLDASMRYKSPPHYKNISPDERDRWKSYLAQSLGKPKDKITMADWEDLQHSWKYPSLISSALDCGWRAEMVGRLTIDLVDLQAGQIVIPPEVSVKNNEKWIAELSDRSVKMMDRWLEQRNNKQKYDESDNIWLNRKGNPYNSRTLNTHLDNLIDKAGLNRDDRKLTWHSIRHSTGMYVYDRQKDLELVAEILRHTSLDTARTYAHPTPETKQDVIESIQGGV